MLNLTMRQDSDILLYEKTTGNLLGAITCESTGGGKSASLQFRLTSNIIVVRKELVETLTSNFEKCPQSLLERFGGSGAKALLN